MKNQPNFCSLREKLHKIAPIKLLCPSSLGKLQLEISDQGLGVVQMPSDHLSTWHLWHGSSRTDLVKNSLGSFCELEAWQSARKEQISKGIRVS